MEQAIDERKEQRADLIHGLRALADFLEDPSILCPVYVPNIWVGVEDLKEFEPIIHRAGRVSKRESNETFDLMVEFSKLVKVGWYIQRNLVCEQVKTGTKTVKVQKVVQPAITEEITEEQDVYEWKCPSLLESFKENKGE